MAEEQVILLSSLQICCFIIFYSNRYTHCASYVHDTRHPNCYVCSLQTVTIAPRTTIDVFTRLPFSPVLRHVHECCCPPPSVRDIHIAEAEAGADNTWLYNHSLYSHWHSRSRHPFRKRKHLISLFDGLTFLISHPCPGPGLSLERMNDHDTNNKIMNMDILPCNWATWVLYH